MKFSTPDQNNGPFSNNCSKEAHGAWWYNNCDCSNLNGKYKDNPKYDRKSNAWGAWTPGEPLKTTRLMIRPANI